MSEETKKETLDDQINRAVSDAFRKHFSESLVVDVPPHLRKEIEEEMRAQARDAVLTPVPRSQMDLVEDILRTVKSSNTDHERLMLEAQLADCETNIASHSAYVEKQKERREVIARRLTEREVKP